MRHPAHNSVHRTRKKRDNKVSSSTVKIINIFSFQKMSNAEKALENEWTSLSMEEAQLESKKSTKIIRNYLISELLAFLSGEMKKLEEDEKQIRIVIEEHEELVRQEQENLHNDNPQGSTDQHNLLALPSVPNYIENSTETEQQPAANSPSQLDEIEISVSAQEFSD